MQQHAGSLNTYFSVRNRPSPQFGSAVAMRRPKGRLPAAARHPQSAVGVAGAKESGVSTANEALAHGTTFCL
jgi:hypothetical protein